MSMNWHSKVIHGQNTELVGSETIFMHHSNPKPSKAMQDTIPDKLNTSTPLGLLNRKQIARFIGVSERTIGNMIRMRRIPIIKWGRNVRFDPVKVLRALNKYEIEEV